MEKQVSNEPKKIHEVDKFVGQKLRQRRWVLGMTQQQLASAVGIRFQQIQKYETGSNRVSASRLWDISKVLEIPISYFFDGIEPNYTEAPIDDHDNVWLERDSAKLIQYYRSLPENQRKSLLQMAQSLSEN